MQPLRVGLVCCQGLTLQGGNTPATGLLVAKAVALLKQGILDYVVLAGGPTQPDVAVAEAEAALRLVPFNLKNRFLVETKSRTTGENIEGALALAAREQWPEVQWVITSTAAHIPHIELLVRRNYPHMRHTSVPVNVGGGWGEWKHRLVYGATLLGLYPFLGWIASHTRQGGIPKAVA